MEPPLPRPRPRPPHPLPRELSPPRAPPSGGLLLLRQGHLPELLAGDRAKLSKPRKPSGPVGGRTAGIFGQVLGNPFHRATPFGQGNAILCVALAFTHCQFSASFC